MEKEVDLISILLNETYGNISEGPDSDEVSLSDYFQEKQSEPVELSSCDIQIYPEFARIMLGNELLDIPFELGIIEKSYLENCGVLRLTPIADFVWMSILSEHFSKRVTWMGFSSIDKKIFFLTKKEAEILSTEKNESKKVA